MRDKTFVSLHEHVLATEAPDVATAVAEIKKTSRTNVASKGAPKKPTVISVSVDNTTL